jgi:spermidine synthase
MIILNSVLLAIICLLLVRSKHTFISIAAIVTSIYINKYATDDKFDLETGIATYRTIKVDGGKALVINETYYSSVKYDDNSSSYYNNYLRNKLLNGSVKKEVLVLGAGGFTLSIADIKNSYTYVDLDPKLKDAIKLKFNSNPIGKYFAQDARAFVNNNNKLFDVIVLDVFPPHNNNIPEHLLTVEFFESLKKSLKPNGSFAINFIHKGPVSSSVEAHKTLKGLSRVFGACYVVPMGDGILDQPRRIRNSLGVCMNNSISTTYRTDNEY